MDPSHDENVWKLMSEYKFKLDPDVFHTDMSCIICKNIMIDSCHSTCGCQYCYKCISDYIGNDIKYCPGNNTRCKEDFLCLDRDVIRDTRMNNKIFKSRVICPNGSCGYKTELEQIQEHLRLCNKQSMECLYSVIGCDYGENNKEDIMRHLLDDTLPHTHILLVYISNLKNEVNESKVLLETSKLDNENFRENLKEKERQITEINKEFEILKREFEDQKKDLAKINKVLMDQNKVFAVQKKDFVDQKKDLVNQNKDLVEIKKVLMDQNKDLLDQKKDFAIQKKDFADQKKDLAEIKKVLMDQNKDLFDQKKVLMDQTKDLLDQKKDLADQKNDFADQKKVLGDLRKESETVKEEFVKKGNEMATLERELRNEMKSKLSATTEESEKIKRATEDQIRGINVVMDDLKGEIGKMIGGDRRMNNPIKLCPNIDGDFVWRIDGISGKMKSMQGKRIYSDSFYSNNYKFSLYIWIDGDNIYLRCVIMKGDNDGEVKWPMPLPVTLAIINQDTLRTHETWRYKYDSYKGDKSAFDRPRANMNECGIGGGYAWINYLSINYAWIKYASIKDNGSVVVGDSVIVSCVIGDK